MNPLKNESGQSVFDFAVLLFIFAIVIGVMLYGVTAITSGVSSLATTTHSDITPVIMFILMMFGLTVSSLSVGNRRTR